MGEVGEEGRRATGEDGGWGLFAIGIAEEAAGIGESAGGGGLTEVDKLGVALEDVEVAAGKVGRRAQHLGQRW